MRQMTVRILRLVIIASVVCVLALLLLVGNVDRIARQYENNLKITSENQRLVAEICEDMYAMESLVWQHIVSTEGVDADAKKAAIEQYMEALPEYLEKLQENLSVDEDQEMAREVVRQYLGFKANVEVVLDLSESGSKKTAQYYVDMKLNPYFDMVNQMLDSVNARMEENNRQADLSMESRIRMARLEAFLCIVVAVFTIGCCIIGVSKHGRIIVGTQEEEQKSHQQKVMTLQYNTIVAMANLIEGRNEETGEHVKRTSWYVNLIARKLAQDSPYSGQLTEEYLENLWKAAPLHDIGKIRISDTILCKPGKLTLEEFEIMKTHASEGGQIVYETMKDIEEREYVEMAHDVAKYHHEKWDGSGYPEGRVGDAIPLCARIMAVADVFDALISKRCYKDAFDIEEAFQIIKQSLGSHFDPVVAGAFLELRPQVEEYLRQ